MNVIKLYAVPTDGIVREIGHKQSRLLYIYMNEENI